MRTAGSRMWLLLLTLESQELTQHCPFQEEEYLKGARAMEALGSGVTSQAWPAETMTGQQSSLTLK